MRNPHFFRRFDYDRSKSVNGYLGLLDFKIQSSEEASLEHSLTGKIIGYPGWNLIYYLAMTSIRPNSSGYILETGTNYGLTTIVLAQVLRDINSSGKVISFEIDETNLNIAEKNIKNAGLSNYVELILGDSFEGMSTFDWTDKNIEFAFLDACHEFDFVAREYLWTIDNIKSDGLIVLDNTYQIAEENEDPRVNGFLRALDDQGKVNIINLPFVSWFTPGLAVIQKNPNWDICHD